MSESINNIDLELRARFLQLNIPYQSEPLPVGADIKHIKEDKFDNEEGLEKYFFWLTRKIFLKLNIYNHSEPLPPGSDTKSIKEFDLKGEFLKLSSQDAAILINNFGCKQEFVYVNGDLIKHDNRIYPSEEMLNHVFYFDKENLLKIFTAFEKQLLNPFCASRLLQEGVMTRRLQFVEFILAKQKNMINLYKCSSLGSYLPELIREVNITNNLGKTFAMIELLMRAGFEVRSKDIEYLNREILRYKSQLKAFEENDANYRNIKIKVMNLENLLGLIQLIQNPTIPVAPPPPSPFEKLLGLPPETRTVSSITTTLNISQSMVGEMLR